MSGPTHFTNMLDARRTSPWDLLTDERPRRWRIGQGHPGTHAAPRDPAGDGTHAPTQGPRPLPGPETYLLITALGALAWTPVIAVSYGIRACVAQ